MKTNTHSGMACLGHVPVAAAALRPIPCSSRGSGSRLYLVLAAIAAGAAFVAFPLMLQAEDAGAIFEAGPNLNVGRMNHYSAVLPDGRVGVFGGTGNDWTPLSTSEVWDPATGAFTLLAMNHPRTDCAFAKLPGGKFLLAGGIPWSYGVGLSSVAEIFDPAANTFTPTGSLNYARGLCRAGTLSDGRVLVVGNWVPGGGEAPELGELYDPDTGTFSLTGPLQSPRTMAYVLATNDGRAVVFGGMSAVDYQYIGAPELYDPATNSFQSLPDPGWWASGSHVMQPLENVRMSDGRYLLYGWDNAGAFLFTFDPATLQFARFDTTPPFTGWPPLVDAARGKAYGIGFASTTSPVQVFLLTVNLASGDMYVPEWACDLGPDYSTYLSSSVVLPDGRIFMTGGSPTFEWPPFYVASTRTFLLTPLSPVTNQPPVANAGPDQSGVVGRHVTLDGSASSDPDNDPLTYAWNILTAPAGSLAALDSMSSVTTGFTPDLPGTYVVQLTVGDGTEFGTPDTAVIEVLDLQSAVLAKLESLAGIVAALDDNCWKNPNMHGAMLNKIEAVTKDVTAGRFHGALEKLRHDMTGKTDGCPVSGSPDKNDWIIKCHAQQAVYPVLLEIMDMLEILD